MAVWKWLARGEGDGKQEAKEAKKLLESYNSGWYKAWAEETTRVYEHTLKIRQLDSVSFVSSDP